MDQLYEDIIESLELKPSLEPAKRKENKELEPILNKIKNLLYIKKNDQRLIQEILEDIKQISEIHHIRINHLLDDKINEKELDFALKIFYNTPEIQKIHEKIKEYKEEENTLFMINKTITSVKEKKEEILKKINNIKELFNNQNKNIITKIKEKFSKKKNIETIKQEIISLINKTKNEFVGNSKLEELIDKLNKTNITQNNLDEISEEITKVYDEISKKLVNKQEGHKKSVETKRISIRIPQEQLSRLAHINERNYLFDLMRDNFRKNKYKKEMLISKIILLLKLINVIEQNKTEEIDKINELLKRKEQFEQIENNTKETTQRKK